MTTIPHIFVQNHMRPLRGRDNFTDIHDLQTCDPSRVGIILPMSMIYKRVTPAGSLIFADSHDLQTCDPCGVVKICRYPWSTNVRTLWGRDYTRIPMIYKRANPAGSLIFEDVRDIPTNSLSKMALMKHKQSSLPVNRYNCVAGDPFTEKG